MLGLLKIVTAALLCARWLLPAEAAAQGDTLWITQLWPAVLVLWAWYALRMPGVRIRWGLCDVMLALVIAGHLISETSVLLTEGQKRAAVNLSWEWIGLGIGFFLLRQLLVGRVDRDRILLAFTAIVVSLSGFGIWQHFVFYPQSRARYAPVRDRLDGLLREADTSPSSATADRQRRIRQATNELLHMGVPPEALSGRMRRAFESRLETSSEPFGPFALANTFAGFLAMGLILLVAAAHNLWRSGHAGFVRGTALSATIVLVTFCLLLTKSRTAWVGTSCGLAAIAVFTLRKPRSSSSKEETKRWSSRQRWLILLGIGAIMGVLLIVSVSSGGLDSAVLSEAPKSLSYRIEYWTGSWAVVREHPWLGIGPGNFRQHYLQHKLPGSSEEIADPHNWLLGIWTNGGLLAVCGLVGLLAFWTVTVSRRSITDDVVPTQSISRPSPWLWGTAFGFVLVLVFRAVLEDRFDIGLTCLLAGWMALIAFFRGRSNLFTVSSVGIGAAVLTVMVHLLGAGGIEMPAVVQTILLLLATGLSHVDGRVMDGRMTNDPPQSGLWRGRLVAIGTGSLGVVLFVSCFFTASRPVLNCQSLVAMGDAAISEENNFAAAERAYTAAATADPLSPEPVNRLAELEFQKWKQARRPRGRFDHVVKFSVAAIRLDPNNWLPYRDLGNRYREAFRRTHAAADAVAAADYLALAVDRYPNNALLRADLAAAYADAGDTSQSRRQAKRAIRLDDLNRQRGHRDRLLPADVRRALEQLL